jgi:hypothetical protein
VACKGVGLAQRGSTAEARRELGRSKSSSLSSPNPPGQIIANPLVLYDSACRALAEARSVDEVTRANPELCVLAKIGNPRRLDEGVHRRDHGAGRGAQ